MGNPTNDYRSSVAQRYDGAWMPPEVLGALPQLRRDYTREADPGGETMRLHLEKPEAQRRQEGVAHEARLKSRIKAIEQDNERGNTSRGEGEQTDGRGSSMVGKDHPRPVLRPPQRIARPVEASLFKAAWLAEQCDAAMAKAKSHGLGHTREPVQANTYERQIREPER